MFDYGPIKENIGKQIYHGKLNSSNQSYGEAESRYVNNDQSTIKHIGEWNNGYLHGKGQTEFITKDKSNSKLYKVSFSGSWVDGKRHGEGRLVLSNGSFYVGGFQFGKLHGFGKFTCPSLFEYTGEFFKGFVAGRGSVKFFSGQFSDQVVQKIWHQEHEGLTVRDAVEYVQNQLNQEHLEVLEYRRSLKVMTSDEDLNRRVDNIKLQIKQKRINARKAKDEAVREEKVANRRQTKLMKSRKSKHT